VEFSKGTKAQSISLLLQANSKEGIVRKGISVGGVSLNLGWEARNK